MPTARSKRVRHTKLDPAYLPFLINGQRKLSIKSYHPEWVLADRGSMRVIMGNIMAKLCYIEIVPTDLVVKEVANTVEAVQGISKDDVTIVLWAVSMGTF